MYLRKRFHSQELKKKIKKKTIEYFLGNITGSIRKKTQDRKSCDCNTCVNLSLQNSLFKQKLY